jgi:hypothetical protein
MIRINLHDYRYELRKIEIQKQVVKCSAIIVVAVFFIIAVWFIEQARLDSVKFETRQLESQVAGLASQFKKVKAMEAKQNRMKTIIAGIEGLREKQMPASTIVSDLNMAVTEGLWLFSIIQRDEESLRSEGIPFIMFGDPEKNKKKKGTTGPAKEFVEVSGYAITEKAVVEYMKKLQEIPYYETTFLYESSQVVYKSKDVSEGPVLYNFIIYCYMPEKKKSA